MELNNEQKNNRKASFLILTFIFSFIAGFVISQIFFPSQNAIQEIRTEGNAYIDFISGTEYIAGMLGDQGQTIIRVSDYKGNPLTATCNATIVYPNKTVYLMLDQLMTASSIQGNYYTTFQIPSVSGIYEEYVVCEVNVSGTMKTTKTSSSFHVSPILDLFTNISSQISGLNESLYNVNGSISNQITDTNNSISTQISQTNSSLSNQISQLNTTIGNVQTNIENFLSAYLRAFSDLVGTISSGDVNSILDRIFGTISPVR